MGLNYISHPAGNACFLINGEERSSSSNHFTVGKLFDVQIKAVSPEDKPVHIGLKTDTESITDNINQLIGSYNSFIRSAASYLETQSRSRQLVREFSSIASHYGTSLEIWECTCRMTVFSLSTMKITAGSGISGK